MIQLIVGHKGSGKTKAMVEMANKAVKESKGYVVVIEKDVCLFFVFCCVVFLVFFVVFAIAGYDAVYGFITGLLAGNYDITHIYIDPVFKMCGRDFEAFTQMVNKLDSLRATQDVQIIFTLSCEPEDLPYHLRDMMIENW